MDSGKIIGGGSAGIGIGTAAVYIAGRFGAHLTDEDGAIISAAAITIGAFIAHNGIRGMFSLIWRGGGSSAEPAPSEPAPSDVMRY